MHPVAFTQRDGPAQRFAIQADLKTAALTSAPLGQRGRKELAQGLLELLGIHPGAQHTTPGTVMWHRLALQGKQELELPLTQLSPMGNTATTILSGQFGQHPNQ
jgi:hypothetical protein